MSISRSNTDAQKRLAAISRQLYGKSDGIGKVQNTVKESSSQTNHARFRYTDTPTPIESGLTRQPTEIIHDTKYLQKDLLKIFLLATVTIAIQLSLKLVLKI